MGAQPVRWQAVRKGGEVVKIKQAGFLVVVPGAALRNLFSLLFGANITRPEVDESEEKNKENLPIGING